MADIVDGNDCRKVLYQNGRTRELAAPDLNLLHCLLMEGKLSRVSAKLGRGSPGQCLAPPYQIKTCSLFDLKHNA
jgi:hypothetical protein